MAYWIVGRRTGTSFGVTHFVDSASNGGLLCK